MKIFNLILWDMRFQAKYGFYLLYAFLTVLYTAVLVSIPQSIKPALSAILIFSDPAAWVRNVAQYISYFTLAASASVLFFPFMLKFVFVIVSFCNIY